MTPALVPPERGGPPWSEIVSQHLVLDTDLPPPGARRALVEFETYYQALVATAFPVSHFEGERIRIVLFARAVDLHAFTQNGVEGFSLGQLPNDPEPTPTLVLSSSFDDSTRVLFLHELTHRLIARSFRAAPAWFDEGLALYESTLLLEGGSLYLGLPLPTLPLMAGTSAEMRRVGRYRVPVANDFPLVDVPPVAELVRSSSSDFYGSREALPQDRQRVVSGHYAGAWALLHMVHRGDARYRIRYSQFLAAALGGQPVPEAWAAAFGEIPESVFQGDFFAYLSQFEAPVVRRPYAAPELPSLEHERVMSEAEVHLLWARLRPWGGEASDQAAKDIDAALAAEPASAEVRFWRGVFRAKQGRFRDAQDDFAAALASAPDEPRYLLGFAIALSAELRSLGAFTTHAAAREAEISSRRLAAVVQRLRRGARSPSQMAFIRRYDGAAMKNQLLRP